MPTKVLCRFDDHGTLSPPGQNGLGRCLLAALTLICASCLFASAVRASAAPSTETIVLLRHGEKPEQGLGQLNCKGLNRALALGTVLKRVFGRPDAIFAPDPAIQKQDRGRAYDYVRPLATIEPAAIAFGLPVNAHFGVSDISALARALEAPALRSALVVVAWEHLQIVALARLLLDQNGGRPADVPAWSGPDFDSMYVIRVVWDGTASASRFERVAEGLDGVPSVCVEGR